jgi:hypothetical protein
MDDDPLRYARRLHQAMLTELDVATRMLNEGRAAAYLSVMKIATSLAFSAEWAALNPSLGPEFLQKHGIDLHHREEPTRPLRVRVGRSSEGE